MPPATPEVMMVDQKKQPWMPWIIASLLWLCLLLSPLYLSFVDLSLSERINSLPSDLANPDKLPEGLSIVPDHDHYLLTYRFRVWRDSKDQEAILARSSDEDFQRAIKSVFESRRRFQWLVMAYIFFVFVVFGLELYKRREEGGLAGSIEKYFDYRMVPLFFAGTCIVTVILFQEELFTTSEHISGFWQGHVEFFLIWSVFLAMVGAYYAVLAKRRADDSFEKGQEIYEAITAFFDEYADIMSQGKGNKRSVLDLIKKSQRSLTMSLGSPLVGYFRDEETGVTFCSKLNDKLVEYKHKNFTVKFLCWNDAECAKHYNRKKKKKPIDKVLFLNNWATLSGAITGLGRERGYLYRYKDGASDPSFRFVISDEKEAIFWLLQGTSPDDVDNEDDSGPIGGGFTTDRPQMVSLLLKIFEAQQKRSVRQEVSSSGASNDATPLRSGS